MFFNCSNNSSKTNINFLDPEYKLTMNKFMDGEFEEFYPDDFKLYRNIDDTNIFIDVRNERENLRINSITWLVKIISIKKCDIVKTIENESNGEIEFLSNFSDTWDYQKAGQFFCIKNVQNNLLFSCILGKHLDETHYTATITYFYPIKRQLD